MSFYLLLKFLHLLGIILWSSASFSLGVFMLLVEFKNIECDKQFLQNVYKFFTRIEVFGFFVVIVTGLLMFFNFYYAESISWIKKKVIFSLIFFIPIEFINIYLLEFHTKKPNGWKFYNFFNLIVLPFVTIVFIYVIFLAVFKP